MAIPTFAPTTTQTAPARAPTLVLVLTRPAAIQLPVNGERRVARNIANLAAMGAQMKVEALLRAMQESGWNALQELDMGEWVHVWRQIDPRDLETRAYAIASLVFRKIDGVKRQNGSEQEQLGAWRQQALAILLNLLPRSMDLSVFLADCQKALNHKTLLEEQGDVARVVEDAMFDALEAETVRINEQREAALGQINRLLQDLTTADQARFDQIAQQLTALETGIGIATEQMIEGVQNTAHFVSQAQDAKHRFMQRLTLCAKLIEELP